MSEILIRKELRELRRKLESVKAERDALEKSVEMLAKSLGYAIWGEQEALQRVNALAVENACLVKAINDHKNSTHFCERCGEDDPCATDDVCSVLRGIPATSAALAAIEAQGVEKFIKLKMEQLANMHPDTHAFGATAESLRAQLNELQAFAANIREAK